eukprot:CAMPEP_0185787508 /NCGR_PEP_ID=MMETSP1174-20130828/141118_1 /TAXON_ID=35687 /ORGANISM="Dictyocha speculum, Strain CCMP1381" /LENGTH=55 /DNA_ID=CAMNT_0028480713 /DNA_START=223 /DNA_END=387 /DNA_ORIENTATION=+
MTIELPPQTGKSPFPLFYMGNAAHSLEEAYDVVRWREMKKKCKIKDAPLPASGCT